MIVSFWILSNFFLGCLPVSWGAPAGPAVLGDPLGSLRIFGGTAAGPSGKAAGRSARRSSPSAEDRIRSRANCDRRDEDGNSAAIGLRWAP